MSLLSKLERRFGRMAIPNITLIIVLGQAVAYLLAMMQPGTAGDPTSSFRFKMALIPTLVLHGEVWRLFSFIFFPSSENILFLFFDLYFFYFMGQALEANWGAFRYNVYLLIAYVMTVAAAFVQPDYAATNLYIGISVFLAFAFLFPEFVMLLFLVLPVKMKWASWLAWAYLLFMFVIGDVQTKLLIVASVLNFLLFFGKDIIHHAKTGHRRLKNQAEKVQQRDKPFHVCAVCGITDKTNPKMDFRYCPLCVGSWGYCTEHLLHHEHKTQPPE
ncbi:MAG TPA: hypothetical protein VGG19_12170 [Tepidisphaeraceae bacterium]|jgi:hypothetical protein